MTYLVGVAEPRRTLLLIGNEGDPLVTAAAEPLPDVRVAAHAASLLGAIKWLASSGADSVRERLVVPVGRVFQHQPAPTGLAEAAVAFTVDSSASHVPGSV